MKLGSVRVKNFASYAELNFDFNDLGLTLVSGPTGAGKSTLCDVAPWVLFGRSSKNGAVDEVVSWNTQNNTTGELTIEINNKTINVFRSRKPNDLYFTVDSSTPIRGKDLTDTQKLLDKTLGFSYETFISGSYFHEFSQAANFFITTAKIRRALIEQTIDLTLVKTLQEGTTLAKKEFQKVLDVLETKISLNENSFKNYTEVLKNENQRVATWQSSQQTQRIQLEKQAERFESSRDADLGELKFDMIETKSNLLSKIEQIQIGLLDRESLKNERAGLSNQLEAIKSKVCQICGSDITNTTRLEILNKIRVLDTKLSEYERAHAQLEHAQDSLDRLDRDFLRRENELKTKLNPYVQQLETLSTSSPPNNIDKYEKALLRLDAEASLLKKEMDSTKIQQSDIILLSEIIDSFRLNLVESIVSELEYKTNKVLNDHFDAEIRVGFELESSDKINSQIYKDGHEASYTQLSKGQRQLLKLSFGLAMMETVQLHNNFSFSTVFLDEALDGLDDSFKLKAFSLLEELSQKYPSVLVVEHNEALKAMFSNTVKVSLVNGQSSIEKT